MAFKMINISLGTMKDIVAKASEELGNQDSCIVTIIEDELNSQWGTREDYYKPKLSSHDLKRTSDTFYGTNEMYSKLS